MLYIQINYTWVWLALFLFRIKVIKEMIDVRYEFKEYQGFSMEEVEG